MKKILFIALILLSLNSFSQEFKFYAKRTNIDNTVDSLFRKVNTDSFFINGVFVQMSKMFFDNQGVPDYPQGFDKYFQTADNIWTNRTKPYPTYILFIHADASGNLPLTDHPNSEQPLANSQRSAVRVNTEAFTQARLTCIVMAQSNSVNEPRIYFQYSTDGVNWIGNGSGASLSSTGAKETAWIDLPAGAIGDVYVRVAMNGGNGAADPALGHVTIQFR